MHVKIEHTYAYDIFEIVCPISCFKILSNLLLPFHTVIVNPYIATEVTSLR